MCRAPNEYAPGDKVVIILNPHRARASNVIGTVLGIQAGRGFMGRDLIDVEFVDPASERVCQLPFGHSHLRVANEGAMRELASRHEDRAKQLRRLAEEVELLTGARRSCNKQLEEANR